jgi:hypothetical protein
MSTTCTPSTGGVGFGLAFGGGAFAGADFGTDGTLKESNGAAASGARGTPAFASGTSLVHTKSTTASHTLLGVVPATRGGGGGGGRKASTGGGPGGALGTLARDCSGAPRVSPDDPAGRSAAAQASSAIRLARSIASAA